MIAIGCTHESYKRHGRDRKGQQRYRCRNCGTTWTEERTRPLGTMRISLDRAVMCLRLLLEGNSIRSVERLTGTNRNTIMDLLVLVGHCCRRYMDKTMRDIVVQEVQADEIWSFVGCKERNREKLGLGFRYGDQYCYVGIERHSKLVLAWHSGRRNDLDSRKFIDKLGRATAMVPFELYTDGWGPYRSQIPGRFRRHRVNFAQLIKTYTSSQDETRYSPAQIASVRRRQVCGHPDMDSVCTSHVERHNLSMRMGIRRFARLTNAFSKRIENHVAALGLYFAHYNFVKRHGTLGTTPAVEHGITDHEWTMRELLETVADY